MAQTYTLDEAAAKLNLSVDEFKRRLREEWKHVRSFRDGSTLRFRANDIDDLLRTTGGSSSDDDSSAIVLNMDDEPTIADAPVVADSTPPTQIQSLAPDIINLDDDDDSSLKMDSDDIILLPDVSASGKIKSGSDSDVRLEKQDAPKPNTDSDDESILTDEFEVPMSLGGSGKLTGRSGKLTSAQINAGQSGVLKKGDSGTKLPQPPQDDSSEFELNLDSDSDDFELTIEPDSSAEISLGDDPGPSASPSGVNLNKPADSGISLEKDSDDEIDFELSLDAPGVGRSGAGLGSSKKLLVEDSDSEFELTIEEPSDLSLELSIEADGGDEGKDIFEATDFEIPSLEDDSASEVISLDDDTDLESSEFDLELDIDGDDDASASEVVAIDDDDLVQAKSKQGKGKAKSKKKPADDDDDDVIDLDDLELDDGPSASMALKGLKPAAIAGDDDDDEYEGEVITVAKPAEWGLFPTLMMLPTMIVLVLVGLMAYELIHYVWGYQQPNKPTTPIINAVADMMDMKPKQ
ncbi:MAG: hypothetical protein R3B84_17390 [Zavarzinella sp.]